MRYLVLLLAVAGLGACAASVQRDKAISPGQKLLRAKCTSCHIAPLPEKYDLKKWSAMVLKYGDRVRLNPEQMELLKGLHPNWTNNDQKRVAAPR